MSTGSDTAVSNTRWAVAKLALATSRHWALACPTSRFPSWRALNANFHTVEWVILAYQIASMVLCVGIGRFADIVGYRRVFLYGAMLFTALLMAPRGG